MWNIQDYKKIQHIAVLKGFVTILDKYSYQLALNLVLKLFLLISPSDI